MGALEHRDGSLWPDQSTSFATCCSFASSSQQVKSYPWIFVQGASVVLCAVHIFGRVNMSVEKLQVTAAQDPGSVQGFFFSLICNCHLLVLLIIFHLGDW
ncbi:hypothetical protein V8C40DRAFT_239924 [Trichoderma camerunense]